jgi:hypothetical protein
MDFKTAKSYIVKKQLCKELGVKYTGKVNSVTFYQEKYIVNLDRMSTYHFDEAKRLLKEGIETGDEAMFQLAANQNLTLSIRENASYIPAQGEIIEFVLGTVFSKKSNQDITAIVGYNPLKAGKTITVSLDDIEELVKSEDNGGAEKPKEEILKTA